MLWTHVCSRTAAGPIEPPGQQENGGEDEYVAVTDRRAESDAAPQGVVASADVHWMPNGDSITPQHLFPRYHAKKQKTPKQKRGLGPCAFGIAATITTWLRRRAGSGVGGCVDVLLERTVRVPHSPLHAWGFHQQQCSELSTHLCPEIRSRCGEQQQTDL